MTTLFVEALTRNMWRSDAHVTGGKFGFFREFLQFFDHRGAAWKPEWQPGADVVVDDEDLQFLAELTMVAFLRFLEHREVFVELGLVLEGGAVDALELRILFVAFVIGAGDMGEFERADVTGAHNVRTGAEIGELAVAIDRDLFAFGNVLDDIEFEFARRRSLTEGAKGTTFSHGQSVAARQDNALEGMIGFDFFFHLGLDLLEVFGRNAVPEFDVVIEIRSRPAARRRIEHRARS